MKKIADNRNDQFYQFQCDFYIFRCSMMFKEKML